MNGPPPPPFEATAGSGPKATRSLPLSSSTSLSAVFLPRPGTEASLITSPLATASETSGGVMVDSTESASFGPTLLTAVSASNAERSSLAAKPNRSIASSRTTMRVWITHSSPSEGNARRVPGEAGARRAPAPPRPARAADREHRVLPHHHARVDHALLAERGQRPQSAERGRCPVPHAPNVHGDAPGGPLYPRL